MNKLLINNIIGKLIEGVGERRKPEKSNFQKFS